MPSCPGSWLVIMQAQAGTVIGGLLLRRRPHAPCSIRRRRFGRSSLNLSKTRSGAAQSSPRTATFMARAFSRGAGRGALSGSDGPAVDGADGGRDLRPDHAIEVVAGENR